MTKRTLGIMVLALATAGCGAGRDPFYYGHHGFTGAGTMHDRVPMHDDRSSGYGSMMGGSAIAPAMMLGGDTVAETRQRLAGLRSTLGITPQQEPAWDAYAETVMGRAHSLPEYRESMEGAGTVVPERDTAWREDAVQQRRTAQAFEELYSVLTPAQRDWLHSHGMGYP